MPRNDSDIKTGIRPKGAFQYTQSRSIVIEELRLVYVPIPKAACTSLFWLLADLLGIPAKQFEDPNIFRPTNAQTIQNIELWPPEYRIQCSDPSRIDEVAASEDWFRFSVVRDPARRLWSAWQSKLLLRLPGYVRLYGEEPWFPDVPSSAQEVLESFERFVAALDGNESQRPKDVHWERQTELLGEAVPLTHVGRVETLGDTLELLGGHVASFGRDLPPIRRENTTPLPFPDGLLSGETTRIIREHYAPDYQAFGYDEPETTPPAEATTQEWRDRTDILLDSVRAIILHNERLATLNESLKSAGRHAEKVLQDNESLHQQLVKRNKQLRQAENRLEELHDALRSARTNVEVREKRIAELSDRVEVREKRIAELSGRVAVLKRRLRAMHASRSWRLTAPLRWLVGAVKRARRSLSQHIAPSRDPRGGT